MLARLAGVPEEDLEPLVRYIAERVSIIADLEETQDVDRSAVKTQFVSMLNGGHWYPSDWVRDNDATKLPPCRLLEFLTEFKACCQLVAEAVIAASVDPANKRIPRLPVHFNNVVAKVGPFRSFPQSTRIISGHSGAIEATCLNRCFFLIRNAI